MSKPRSSGVKQRTETLRLPGGMSIRRMALGASIGVAVSLLAALLAAMLISGGTLSAHYTGLWAGVALALGGLVAGVLSGGRHRALITGTLTALCMLAVLVILGAVVYGGTFSVKMCLLMLIILPVSCIIGSVIASFVK